MYLNVHFYLKFFRFFILHNFKINKINKGYVALTHKKVGFSTQKGSKTQKCI